MPTLARGPESPADQEHDEPRKNGIVITKQQAELTIEGTRQKRSLRTLQHFRKIDGRWLLQSAQFTPIKAEP